MLLIGLKLPGFHPIFKKNYFKSTLNSQVNFRKDVSFSS